MTPNERHDIRVTFAERRDTLRPDTPWIIAIGAAVLIAAVLWRLGIFELVAMLICWSKANCVF
jgi:hypothetical protein